MSRFNKTKGSTRRDERAATDDRAVPVSDVEATAIVSVDAPDDSAPDEDADADTAPAEEPTPDEQPDEPKKRRRRRRKDKE